MIYLSVSDHLLTAIYAKKELIGEEKVVAFAKKELEADTVEKGIIKNSNLLKTALAELLKSAYPKEISDHEVSLDLTTQAGVIHRLTIAKNELSQQTIINEAKKYLAEDISSYENYYKEIKSDDNNVRIIFSALPLALIADYHQLLTSLNLKLIRMSISPYSLFAMVKPFIKEDEKACVFDIAHETNFYTFDKDGPLFFGEKKLSQKNFSTDLKHLVKKIQEDHGLSFNKVILSGEKSPEFKSDELKEDLNLEIVKANDLLQVLSEKSKTPYDAGGIPLFYFDKVIGLYYLAKFGDVPNFAAELKIIEKKLKTRTPQAVETAPQISPSEVAEESHEKEAEDAKASKEESPEKVAQILPQKADTAALLSNDIVEYRKSNISNLFNKKVLVVLILAIVLIVAGGFLIMGSSANLSLPFMAKPSPTPSITPTPTLTPTPTVDAELKRSDLTLSVLNGTEKSGFARQSADKLEELGYEDIAVANADKQDYAKTVIRIKDSKRKYLPLLLNDLKDDFDTTSIETLPDSEKTDAVVILGQV